jgi:hypothetical protein
MRAHSWTRIGLCLSLTVLLLLAIAGTASAWTATNLQSITNTEDQFYNYDFTTSAAVPPVSVDWPVTIVFTGNASVSKIKTAYKLRGWANPFVTTMYGYENDGSTFAWASDGGVKTIAAKSAHMRLYAPGGRMYNTAWGYYVLATTHYDNAELSKPPTQWFGMSEDAASAAVQTAIKAWGSGCVTYNAFDMKNSYSATTRVVGPTGEIHVWQCDGLATLIRVP